MLRSPHAACALVALVSLTSACSTSTSGAATTTTTASTTTTTSSRDPRMHAALDRLHPEGALPLLERIERTPADAEAYAQAALFYADTDAPGMTIFWGQTYRLLAPEGPRTEAVVRAMRRVFETRVEVSNGTAQVRLAPGSMPVIAMDDGRMLAPFAHRYEIVAGMTFAGAVPNTFENIALGLAHYPEFASPRDFPFQAETELSTYLAALGTAGHLETFAHFVIGPAFPEPWAAYTQTNGTKLAAFRAHLAANPFTPTVGVRPDDLAPLTR